MDKEQSNGGMPEGDHKEHDAERHQTPRRSRWSSAIETFSPQWYALCMNTGLLGILLHQFPYKFSGSNALSTVFWIGDIILFIIFTLVQVARHVLFTQSALNQTFASMEEMCYWGTFPIALATIIAQIGITGSTATSWGASAQHGFAVLAFVLWWIDVAMMLLVAYVMYYRIAKKRMGSSDPLPSSIFLPAVGTSTVGLVGGLITEYSASFSSRLAVPIIITSYMLEGFAWWLAVIIFAIFLNDTWTHGLPPPAKLPGMLMLVGPAGQVGAALIVLGSSASVHFGQYDRGTFLTAASGQVLSAASTMFALLLIGFNIFWLVFILYALVEAGFNKKLTLSMAWWSTIFPVGTLNTTFIVLGVGLNSPTFRGLAAGLYLILLTDYFLCWAMTIYLVWKGKVLDGRQQLEKND